MRRGILILAIAFVMIVRPVPGRAETRVYVNVSVGGAVVIGAGALFWSFSYTSQVSLNKPSEKNPGRLSLTTNAFDPGSLRDIQLIPQLIPQSLPAEERTCVAITSLLHVPYETSSVEVPLLIFRW